MPGLLLLVDFKKAFDSLSLAFIHIFRFWAFISKVDFSFLKNNTLIRVNQGGNFSSPFRLERGCKQGDPISPCIFILCAEILAIKIRNNEKVKGIKINNIDFKLVQFVTTLQ